ncbi:MAG TPA: ABC transporter ATP-binding protein [Acidimicrobiales bacterium]|jgi:ABC-2 type transport system ATP-binding protein
MTAIHTDALTRRFGDELAVDALTLDVAPGEVLALLGPNGAGKTTTVRLLNGVLSPDSGISRVLGLDPATQGTDVRRRTGVLTENAGLDDRLTARENIMAAARIRRVPDADRRVSTLLDQFGMSDRADDRVAGFSTGQRKRVALARSLVHSPEILFLDEPTSGLDPEATRDVVDLIGRLATDHGRTVLLCTHFLGEAGRLADRMAVLDRGHLLAWGSPGELAAELFGDLTVDFDLGSPADHELLGRIRAERGVRSAEMSPAGVVTRVEDRDAVPAIVSLLTAEGRSVFGATPRPPTLEDVYFAVLADRGEVAAPPRVSDAALWAVADSREAMP